MTEVETQTTKPHPPSQAGRFGWISWLSPRRLVWISLLLLHFGPMRSITAQLAQEAQAQFTPATLFRLISLCFWSLFFVLKIVDVAWLRLKPGWQSRIAAMVVVGFIHAGVIERVVAGDSGVTPVQFGFILSAAVSAKGEAVRRRLTFLGSMGSSAAASSARALKGLRGRFIGLHELLRTPPDHFVPSFARLRAPPIA